VPVLRPPPPPPPLPVVPPPQAMSPVGEYEQEQEANHRDAVFPVPPAKGQKRALFSERLSTSTGRRWLWIAAGLSIVGTVAVEMPFLFHLAGTSEFQRLSVLCLGFGIVIATSALLFLRSDVSPTRACVVGLNTAYLANAILCLVVYSDALAAASSTSTSEPGECLLSSAPPTIP